MATTRQPMALVVEDDADSRSWMLAVIAKYQPRFVTEVSETLMDALTKLRGHYYDVVLLDLRIPGVPSDNPGFGVEVVKAASPKSSIVVITGAGDETREMSIQKGAYAWVQKGQESMSPSRNLAEILGQAAEHGLFNLFQGDLKELKDILAKMEKLAGSGEREIPPSLRLT